MPKRINILTRHRLRKVISELKEIQEDSKLNKVDNWSIGEAVGTIQQVLNEPVDKKAILVES